MLGKHFSEEHKAKIRAKLLGIKRSEETRAKLRGNQNFLGKHHSEETKAKIRAKLTGRKHSDEALANMRKAQSGVNHPLFGKHHSEETKAKMREAQSGSRNYMFGKHLSEERKAKIKEAQLLISKTGENSPYWKGNKAKPDAGRDRARKLFKCPKGLERHHIDGNPLNNAPDNIAFVTRKQHMTLDGRLERSIHRLESRSWKSGFKCMVAFS